jgi:hypothetical protein
MAILGYKWLAHNDHLTVLSQKGYASNMEDKTQNEQVAPNHSEQAVVPSTSTPLLPPVISETSVPIQAAVSSEDSTIPAVAKQPTNTSSTATADQSLQTKQPNKLLRAALVIVLVLILLVASAFASYKFGKKSVKPTASASHATTMAVPQGATIIEQCEPGLGTQYVLPKDIPNGPVYNVYQGKLIGMEYMVSAQSLQTLNTSINNLPLFAQTYDHVNIMSMSAHAGFPEPHYQVDVMMVPKATSDKITCGTGSSSSMSGMGM